MNNEQSNDRNQPDRGGISRRGRRRAVRAAGPPLAEEGTTTDSERVGVTSARAAAGPPADLTKAVVEPADPQPAVDAEPVPQQRPRLRRVGAVAAAVALIGLVAGTVLLAMTKHSADSRDAKRQEFIQAARQTVLNLTTIHPDTAKQDVERILANATGEFKEEFDGRIEPFVSVVEGAKVTTDGEIIDAGLESENGDSANVLVAAKSMVTNSGTQEPQPRDFRLRVTVTDEGGRMTTSKVEFVP